MMTIFNSFDSLVRYCEHTFHVALYIVPTTNVESNSIALCRLVVQLQLSSGDFPDRMLGFLGIFSNPPSKSIENPPI